ncbi:LPXTG-domain-containing cell wall anchor protein, putative [Babesia ovis]|uniref:LPXTG-domain-containing cell wall anchor protein, putative n=1 Tax=Babesia ovis TaxID=5869 RepID=A0A9W5TBE0_BABOV|nr:LPXTG-domain-containing cell wall anchor protein, putative [Babesia ovis]
MDPPSSRQRSSQRSQAPERRREIGSRKAKYLNTGLDMEAFARRTKYLREVFMDPERRHLHQWTAAEKKILALDWFHNPLLYKSWSPDQSEDMAARLFSNIVFNYSHLAMINVGYTVTLCRLINEFVDIMGNHQLCLMVVRSEVGEQQPQDMLRVGLIWRGEQVTETLASRDTLIYTSPKSEDFQCLYEGISFNIHSFTNEEFQLYPPCESCMSRKTEQRTRLFLPEICFKSHVAGLSVSSAIVDSCRNYLAAVQKVDGTVHIIDMTKMLQVTLEVVHKWKLVHEDYIKRCRDLQNTLLGKMPSQPSRNDSNGDQLDRDKSSLDQPNIDQPNEDQSNGVQPSVDEPNGDQAENKQADNANSSGSTKQPSKNSKSSTTRQNRSGRAKLSSKKHCTGCLLTEDDLKQLDTLRQQAMEFELQTTPILCKGLDTTTEPLKGVPIRQTFKESHVEFIYTSLETLKVVVPMYVAGIGATRVCVWKIGDVNDGGEREPCMTLQFPEGIRPTDVTSTLGICKDYNNLLTDKFQFQPLIYTGDDHGYLRLWSLGSSTCDASVQVDTHALLSLDVNKSYPNIIAIGLETGKIKLYNIWKQCIGDESTAGNNTNNTQGHQPAIPSSSNVDFIRMTTIPSYLPHDVYEYLRWFHPIVKLHWVNDCFLMAQYAEPLFVKESPNVSTVAIWNMSKDIFDRNDAIICHRSWSQDMTHTWHLSSRLVSLHGGHYASLGGVISSDCKWSQEHGLIAISSDSTGQLHVYKPGVWTWTDYDDGLCLARYTGDLAFHQKIYDRVSNEHEHLMKRGSSDVMASSDLRKNRAKFGEYIKTASRELELLKQNGCLKNDFGSLPMWARHSLKLNANCEKAMKQILKTLRDGELAEHRLAHNPVDR